MAAIAENIGAILSIWGILWSMWDRRSGAAAAVMVIGMAGLVIGELSG